METEFYEVMNEYGITATECAEVLNNFFSALRNINRTLTHKLSNNYLKMHGYTIRRRRALKTFERRYRSE